MGKVQVILKEELVGINPQEVERVKKLIQRSWKNPNLMINSPEEYGVVLPQDKFDFVGEGEPVLKVRVSGRDTSGRVVAIEVTDLRNWRIKPFETRGNA